MAPRPIWSGAIAFGLVNVPVRMFTAVHEHKLQFHLVHEKDDGPIGYQKVCKLEGKPVDSDEIVKAYEIQPGKLVHVTDQDFEAVQVEGHRVIELEDFVPYDDIDPTFFAHAYLVGPAEGAEKTYALLVRAMDESGLAGIGKFVMRNRQYLGCLRVRDNALTLEQMHFADEVDPPAGVIPARLPAVPKRELDLALDLISGFSGKWKPEKYKDTYTQALKKVVRAKLAGKEIHPVPEVEVEEAPDLMEALRASLAQAKRGKKPSSVRASSNGRGSHASSNGNGRGSDGKNLEGLSRKELEERARKLEIGGRSKMSKDELARAVARAS